MRVGVTSLANWVLPLAVLAATLALTVTDFGQIASRVRGLQFDAYQHTQPRAYGHGRTMCWRGLPPN
jgi:hypothetical protein